ncbi:reverse transcriptase family protein [Frigoribacterium sp. CFBP 13605]|uniref:reverse transcriptase family protein n=1 Tax=Frigoribacterium sp. CFBP 13605 TaxID=2774034 RepID=UPI001902DD61|nr:reverse transcriptase family protein [Frigoribacterium sp. CFBP 13605]
MTAHSPASAVGAREPDPGPDAVATALADALLAAEWTVGALAAAAGEAVDGPARFWRPLARDLVRALPRAPHDDPRTLTAHIRRDPAFTEAVTEARKRGRPLRIVHHVPVTQEARSADPRLLRLGTVADVARLLHLTVGELDWFADPGRWNRRIERGPLQHHRYEWRARPGRTPRLLEVPGFRLRDLHRVVLDEVLAAVPLHDAAHGFVPGRSAVTGARRHVGREVVIALDLTSFFARVTAGQVFGALRREGLPDAVAHVLTGLCTTSVPPGVLSRMPPGGSPEQRFALRHALSAAHLAQGAPTSPTLANVAVRRLDSRLAGYARAAGATYTRYADDLAFSGDGTLAGRADALVRGVGRIVGDEGHLLNPTKTRVRGAATRQVVTGVVVNAGTNTVRSEYDRLRAVLHNAATTGLEAQNRAGHPDFAAQLWGRIGWVEQLNPGRGARLRAAFARVPR